MDPTIIAAGIGAVGKALTPGSAAPSMSDQLASVGIDFSNWNVSTHGSEANQTATSGKPDSLASALGVPTINNQWVMLAGLALVAIVAVKWIAKR